MRCGSYNAETLPFALCVFVRNAAAERQCGFPREAALPCHHGHPQGQDWGAIDAELCVCGTCCISVDVSRCALGIRCGHFVIVIVIACRGSLLLSLAWSYKSLVIHI